MADGIINSKVDIICWYEKQLINVEVNSLVLFLFVTCAYRPIIKKNKKSDFKDGLKK